MKAIVATSLLAFFGLKEAYTCSIEENVDYYGNDLNAGGKYGRIKGHLPNAEACNQACAETPGCKSWTFVKSEPAGRDNCAVKRTTKLQGNRRLNKGCCDSGELCVVRSGRWAEHKRSQCYGLESEVAAHFRSNPKDGNNVANPIFNGGGFIGTLTLEECAVRCEEKEGCVGFEWSNDEGLAAPATTKANCALAWACSRVEPWSGGNAYMRACAAIERNVDYRGNDLNVGGRFGRIKGHLPNAEACREACIKTLGCKSWTFVKSEPEGVDNCAVKRTTKTEGNVIPDSECCDSGVLCGASEYPSLTACQNAEINVDYFGNDLNAGGKYGRIKGHLPNAEACRQACAETSGCKSWTFVKSEKAGVDNCAVKRTTKAQGNVRGLSRCCDSAEISASPVCEITPLQGLSGPCWDRSLTTAERDARCAGSLVCARAGFDSRSFGGCVVDGSSGRYVQAAGGSSARHHCCSAVTPSPTPLPTPMPTPQPTPQPTEERFAGCPAGFMTLANIDFHGNDLGRCGSLTMEAARKKCLADKECLGFSVRANANGVKLNRPWCLKKILGTPNSRTDHTMCVKEDNNQCSIGCFVDDSKRDMDKYLGRGHDVTKCRNKCADLRYTYFAVQHNDQCFCGNAFSTAPQYKRVSCPIERNVDYFGNDLNAGGRFGRIKGHLPNAAACRQACANTPGCKSWTFVKSEPAGRDNCAVKRTTRAQGNRRTNTGCCDSGEMCGAEAQQCKYGSGSQRRGGSWRNSVYKVECSAVQLSCMDVETNVDYFGNDLNAGGKFGRIKGHLPNAEACRKACLNTAGCKSWTFVKSEPAGQDNCAVKKTTKAQGNRRANTGCCDSGELCDSSDRRRTEDASRRLLGSAQL